MSADGSDIGIVDHTMIVIWGLGSILERLLSDNGGAMVSIDGEWLKAG